MNKMQADSSFYFINGKNYLKYILYKERIINWNAVCSISEGGGVV